MSEYNITLTTSDQQTLSFICAADSDIITAGENAGFTLPSVCRGGCCGICQANCSSGEYSLGMVNASVLSEQAIANRELLLCKAFPKSDLIINTPFAYDQIKFGVQSTRSAVITELSTIAERTVSLKLRWLDNDNDSSVEFEPGQYVELTIADSDIRRAYSLANISNWQGELEFLIRIQRQGQFSSYLQASAKPSDILQVSRAKGDFIFHTGRLNPAIFVAGGTGLAPFLSMLKRMAEWEDDRQILLLFGVNNETELFAVQELTEIQQQLPSLSIQYCLWHPQTDWQGFIGNPAEALQQYLQQQPDDYDLYLCGPPLLMAAVNQVALAAGIEQSQIYVEKFS